MKKSLIFTAIGTVVGTALAAASPASAQGWYGNRYDNQYNNRYNQYDNRYDRNWDMTPERMQRIRADIDRLDSAITQAQYNRTISWREAQNLRNQERYLRRMYWSYSRDGLNRNEVMALEQRANQIRTELRLERADWNDWRN